MGYTFPKNDVIYAVNMYCNCLRGLGGLFTILNVYLHDVQDILQEYFCFSLYFLLYSTLVLPVFTFSPSIVQCPLLMNTKVSTVMLIALYWFETKGCIEIC